MPVMANKLIALNWQNNQNKVVAYLTRKHITNYQVVYQIGGLLL
jgi:hypothetical protein